MSTLSHEYAQLALVEGVDLFIPVNSNAVLPTGIVHVPANAETTGRSRPVSIVVPHDWVCSAQEVELKMGELLADDGSVNVLTSLA